MSNKILILTGSTGLQAGILNSNFARFDGIQLAADNAATVEKDTEGVPTAWQLLKLGKNELTLSGKRADLTLSAEHMDTILNYHIEKGVRIPIDSNHFLSRFADKKGVDESEVLKMVPSGQLAMGFGSLQARADGLWFNNVQFNPLAREMVKEKAFKYFSPVIRGLSDGRLRVTSVAMENEPAINNLDALAASADQRDDQAFKQPKEKKHMKLLCAALGVLLGMDSLSLSADGDAPEGVVEKINNLATELPGLRESKTQHDDFMIKVRDGLKLGADADDSTIHGTIIGMQAKAAGADGMKTRLDNLELGAETAKREGLIAGGLKEGKLSKSMLEWANKQDCIALSAFLAVAPVVVPLDKINKDDLKKEDTLALSADEKAACLKAGISEEDYKKNRVA
jgi:phage I-like protein